MAEKNGIAEIISVGNELLSGRTVNTSASFLCTELQKLGLNVKHQQTVADDEKDIVQALRAAVGRSSVIILTGGLGPTEDDLTKETVAKAFGMPLELNEEVLQDIKDFFESRGRQMEENNVKQAMVPKGAVVLKNENGTAPGLYISSKEQAIVLLPGPPYELEPLYKEWVAPRVAAFSDRNVKTATLGVSGIGESELETQIKELLYGENPHSALYAKDGEVSICITAYGDSEEESQQLLNEKKNEFKDKLKFNIYSEDGLSLCESVVKKLMENGKTVAVAESCTGGMMAQQITSIPGSSAVFQYGIASYSDSVKSSSLDVDRDLIRRDTSISSSVAGEMARGARRNGRADFGVGITGLAGPGNSGYFDKPIGLVYISVCDKDKTIVKEFRFGDKRGRDNIRKLSVINAFDMLRRLMNGIEIPDSYTFRKNQISDIENYKAPKKRGGMVIQKVTSVLLVISMISAMVSFTVKKAAAAVRENKYTNLTEEYSQMIKENGSDGIQLLSEEYANCVGWLFNESLDLNTVCVKGRPDDYYDTRDFEGKKNALGCCTVMDGTDYTSTPRNLVVSSICETDGVMLGALEKYLDPTYAEDNPYIYFCSGNFIQYYRIFSAFLLDENEGIDSVFYTTFFRSDEAVQEFVINAKTRSLYDTGEAVYSSDNFITLSSPLNSEYEGCRVIVIGRAVGTTFEAKSDMTAVKNEESLYPSGWYEKQGKECKLNLTAIEDSWYQWLLENDKVKDGRDSLIDAEEKHIKVIMNGEEYESTPLDIISRMVAASIPEDYSSEAMKALAIAYSTELKYRINSGETEIEVKGQEANDTISDAVIQVLNKVVKYQGELCWTPTFYCSSGDTNSALQVYGTDYPYLQSVSSGYDYIAEEDGYKSTIVFKAEDIKKVIEDRYDITLSDDTSSWIENKSWTSVGYVTEVEIDGQITEDGITFYCDVLGLNSAYAEVTQNKNYVTITCYGTGDGVGMSIIGANGYYIGQGWSYESILGHYYTDTTLTIDYWDHYYCN